MFVSLIDQSAGIHFPGALDMSGKQFADMPVDPAAAWAALSWEGQMQIIGFIGFMEFHSELRKPHVLSGGIPGKVINHRLLVIQLVFGRQTPFVGSSSPRMSCVLTSLTLCLFFLLRMSS